MDILKRILCAVVRLFRRQRVPDDVIRCEWDLIPYRFEVDWLAGIDYPSDKIASFDPGELVRAYRYRPSKLANEREMFNSPSSSREQ